MREIAWVGTARWPGAGQGVAEVGSPAPTPSSSTPIPFHPPPRAPRAETHNLSPARLPGEHVVSSRAVATARAKPRNANPAAIARELKNIMEDCD